MAAHICLAKEPILEYKDSQHTLLIEGSRIHIRPDKKYWLFPGIPRKINIGLEVWIPNNCIGLLTKSEFLSPNIQLDTQVYNDSRIIHASKRIPFVYVVNRGWLPTRLNEDRIIAELTIIKKQECHIVNTEG